MVKTLGKTCASIYIEFKYVSALLGEKNRVPIRAANFWSSVSVIWQMTV